MWSVFFTPYSRDIAFLLPFHLTRHEKSVGMTRKSGKIKSILEIRENWINWGWGWVCEGVGEGGCGWGRWGWGWARVRVGAGGVGEGEVKEKTLTLTLELIGKLLASVWKSLEPAFGIIDLDLELVIKTKFIKFVTDFQCRIYQMLCWIFTDSPVKSVVLYFSLVILSFSIILHQNRSPST
jgi:hypothetical protein